MPCIECAPEHAAPSTDDAVDRWGGMDPLRALRQIIDASSVSYPRRLRDLSDAPVALHVAGELPGLERAVAMVGTRAADDEALDFAYALAHDLAREGVVVVSGGAIGIDRAAHEGALEPRNRLCSRRFGMEV